MGRITIFSIDQCPHCQRAKGALKARDIPYAEISLSTHPHRRADMLALSDRLTVPQVFFNDKHIGGADETLELLAQWDDANTSATNKGEEKNEGPAIKTPLAFYQETVASKPDPTDERLRVSTEPPVMATPPLPRPESDKIKLPNGTLASVLEVMEKLKVCLPCELRPYRMKTYTHCFTGKAAVSAMMAEFNCSTEEATAFGKQLQERQVLHHVTFDHVFDNTDDYYFRLQCHMTPLVLNSYRIWTAPADPDAVSLMIRLQKMLGKVEASVTNPQGQVDYKAARQQELFTVFDEAICELQTVDLSQLDRNTMLPFILNLYNVGIKYAFMKVGVIGPSSASRSAFFTAVKFNIGGHLYSFQDLENGILRGNKRAPYSLSVPFSKSDPRYAFALKPEEVDCRIHFALNCGAKSCPPVKSFTSAGIEEELRIVALAFCEDDNNVLVDTIHCKLYLSKILYWYMVDFCSSESQLPRRITDFLRGDKKEKLLSMLPQGVSVKYLDYDWGTNASDAEIFDAGHFQTEYYSVGAAMKAFW